jgi:hypothetical protein
VHISHHLLPAEPFTEKEIGAVTAIATMFQRKTNQNVNLQFETKEQKQPQSDFTAEN